MSHNVHGAIVLKLIVIPHVYRAGALHRSQNRPDANPRSL